MSQLLAPSWAEPLRLSQWMMGAAGDESLPTTSGSFGGDTTLSYVTPEALPELELDLHPLIIRPVYKEIESKLLANIEENFSNPDGMHQGICVTGHPGTGKSTSLWYILISMLRRGHHVLWAGDSQSEKKILFTEEGSFVGDHHSYLDRRHARSPPLGVLWDAARAGPIDHYLYLDDWQPNHVIIAKSPSVLRDEFRKWEKYHAQFITVDCFSREEVAWLKLSGVTKWQKPKACYDVLTMYDYLGPSLHTLLLDKIRVEDGITPQDSFAATLKAAIQAMRSHAYFYWFNPSERGPGGTQFELRAVEHDRAYFCRNFSAASRDDPGSFYRFGQHPSYNITFASKFIALLFYKSIEVKTWQQELEFANLFQNIELVRAAYFRTSSVRFFCWSDRSTTITMAQGQPFVVPSLVPTAARVLNVSTQARPTPGTLYVTPGNLLTIDGLYETGSGTILLFQMTVAATQGASVEELKLLLECYKSDAKRIALNDFVLVFVASNEETKGTYLAAHVNGIEVEIDDKKQNMRVGAVVVDHENQVQLEDLTMKCLKRKKPETRVRIDDKGREQIRIMRMRNAL